MKKKRTKGEVYEQLSKELYDALPEIAKKCDIGIDEAMCDRFDKKYSKFHRVRHEEFT